MNYQDKVEFLRGYHKAKMQIKTYLRQMDDLRDTMMPGGIRYSDMPKHPNYDDKMADYAAKHMDIQYRIDKAQERQLRVIAVINQIAEVDPLGHRILTEMYINNKNTPYICRKLCIGRTTEWQHRKRAIERLDIQKPL